jgi:putative transposase
VSPRRLENAGLARPLRTETVEKHGVKAGPLAGHSDRGAPRTAKSFALLMADLGITQSSSRPSVSDDDPDLDPEADSKALKDRPECPARFGSQEDARSTCANLFDWYHHRDHHSGLGWMTPADVHFGRADLVRARRARTLAAACQRHPERFVRKPPTPPALPGAVWIDQPATGTVPVAQ